MRRSLDADAAPAEIGAKLGRGVAVTALSQLFKLGTQVVSVVVLSRLLTPADFGLVAMVFPVVGLVSLFQDAGLWQALVQRERITSEQVSTVFWINLLVAGLLCGMAVAGAPLVAGFYREPALRGLTAAFAGTFLLTGVSGQGQALLQRQLRFGALAGIEMGAGTAGLAAAILCALLAPSYWALFYSTLAYRLVAAVASWVLTDWRPLRPRLRTGIGDMVRFGGGLTAANVSNYLLRNADNVMVGAYWGPQVLGAYERAYQMLLFPLQQVTWPLGRVMVTTLSRLQLDPARYRDVYLRTVRLMLLAVQPGIVFTIATADLLVPTVLGRQWEQCVPIFVVLGITGLQQPLTGSIGWLLISGRRGTALAWWGAYSLAVILPAFALGLPWGGVGVALRLRRRRPAVADAGVLAPGQPGRAGAVGRPVRASRAAGARLRGVVSRHCFVPADGDAGCGAGAGGLPPAELRGEPGGRARISRAARDSRPCARGGAAHGAANDRGGAAADRLIRARRRAPLTRARRRAPFIRARRRARGALPRFRAVPGASSASRASLPGRPCCWPRGTRRGCPGSRPPRPSRRESARSGSSGWA